MRFLMSIPGLVACAFLAPPIVAQAVYPYPDFNHDCVVDTSDYDYVVAHWNGCGATCPPTCASGCVADLNGDGCVDAIDLGLMSPFYQQSPVACPSFEFHWGVNGSVNVPISSALQPVVMKDVAIFVEQFYGTFPANGPHNMLGTASNYSNWQSNWAAFQQNHVAAIDAFLATEIPAQGLTTAYSGIAVIDYEHWSPIWEDNADPKYATAWKQCISAINYSAWDSAFVSLITYTPPSGVAGYRFLSTAQKEEFAKKSWDFFGHELFLLSMDAGRANLPQAKFTYYGFPRRRYWLSSGQIGYPDEQKAINDQLAWLWHQEDVITPSLYQIYPATVCGALPGGTIYSTQNADAIRYNVAEARRIRDTYRPGVKLLPYVAAYYEDDTSFSTYHYPISDMNLSQGLRLMRYAGADGVILWGYVTKSTCSHPDKPSDCADSFDYELNVRWKPLILETVATCNSSED